MSIAVATESPKGRPGATTFFPITLDQGPPRSRVLSGLDLTWYRRFLATKANGFLLEHVLHHLPFAQQLDLLVFCRNALAPGGRVRFSLPDPAHPLPAYREATRKARAAGLPDAEGWQAILARLGFEPRMVEGYGRDGTLIEADPAFERFGTIRRSSRIDVRRHDPGLAMSSIIMDAVVGPAGTAVDQAWPERVYAIGDSHVRFLAGRDETSGLRSDRVGNWYEPYSAQIVGLHVGPALAFNTNREGTRTRALEKIRLALQGEGGVIPKGARLLFSFGEIDCRCQVVARAEADGLSIDEVVDRICEAYVSFLDETARAGFRPAIWCPVAPTWITHNRDPEYPVVGTLAQRLAATRRFATTISRLVAPRGYPVLSVLEELLTPDGQPKQEFYADAIHLGQRARPLLNALMPMDPPAWSLPC